MKIPLSSPILLLIALALSSCGNKQKEKSSLDKLFSQIDSGSNEVLPKTQWDDSAEDNLPLPQHTKKEHNSRDLKTGLVVWSMDFPSKWTVTSKPTRTFPIFYTK